MVDSEVELASGKVLNIGKGCKHTGICNGSNILLYADDTVLYTSISDKERFIGMHNFQQDTNRLVVWCQRNRLSINVKKPKLVFHPASQNLLTYTLVLK